MPFKKPPQQPEFADLKGILAQVKISHPAIYQTLQTLIDRLAQFRIVTIEQLGDINNSVNNSNTEINIKADKLRTYITVSDETLELPNSRQLIAGTNIELDTNTPGQIIISTTTSGVDHVPMSTGAEPLEIMSNGAGAVLLTEFVP